MNSTIASIIAIVVAGILIRFATKFLLKLLGWMLLLVVGVYGMYHYGIGPFEQNPISIQNLEETYCETPGQEIKCTCIIQIIKADLQNRFTDAEMKDIQDDRAQLLYVMQKSFNKVKPEIQQCLGSKNAEEEFKEFTNDLIPIDNEILERLSKLKDDITETAESQIDDLSSKKKELDEKFEE